jgi:hypothetical protein
MDTGAGAAAFWQENDNSQPYQESFGRHSEDFRINVGRMHSKFAEPDLEIPETQAVDHYVTRIEKLADQLNHPMDASRQDCLQAINRYAQLVPGAPLQEP